MSTIDEILEKYGSDFQLTSGMSTDEAKQAIKQALLEKMPQKRKTYGTWTTSLNEGKRYVDDSSEYYNQALDDTIKVIKDLFK